MCEYSSKYTAKLCPPSAGERAAQVAAVSGQVPEYKPAKRWH